MRLFKLFQDHENFWKTKDASKAAQDLVAVAFSLWRAAFLAEKTGKRSEVFSHGRNFSRRIIEDNAIGYGQDKDSLEWTFNYYTKNARSSLTLLSSYWQEVPKYKGATRPARERWDYCQMLLDEAINNFEKRVAARAAESKKTAERRQVKKEASQRRAKSRAVTLAARPKAPGR
ncbi:hypothetical protein [uncultured Enterovirga sp.]|uniref:hypothetical protein n=1 Tax=uncultured Enterovirga sp. TaxID=2026352 RepID=UPI0035C9B934